MVTIASATIAVLMTAYYLPAKDVVSTEAGFFSTKERCEAEVERIVPIVKKVASDAVFSCGVLEVSEEKRAAVEAFEAGAAVKKSGGGGGGI